MGKVLHLMGKAKIRKITTLIYNDLINNTIRSYVWIRYMAFLLKSENVLQSHKIALRVIREFKCGGEKYVVLACLNMLLLIGNQFPSAFISRMFKSNLDFMQSRIYIQIISICVRIWVTRFAKFLFCIGSEKMKKSPSIWEYYFKHYYSLGQNDQLQRVLKKALVVMSNQKYIRFLEAIAYIDYKSGNKKRAFGIYKKMLLNNPLCLRVWSAYL